MKDFLLVMFLLFSIDVFCAETIFPSNLNKASHLAMTLTGNNDESVIQTYMALQAVNLQRSEGDKIKFLVVIPQAFQPIYDLSELSQVSQKISQIEASIRLKTQSNQPLNWEIIESRFLQYSWLQDIGQSFWIDKVGDGNFSRAFLDVNRPLEDSHPTTGLATCSRKLN